MVALLSRSEKMNKDKHVKHCHSQRKHFYPFVISVRGVIGREALVVLAKLSQLMAVKMDTRIFHVKGWINGWITIIVARSYSQIICRDQHPSPLCDRELYWYPESGLWLAH